MNLSELILKKVYISYSERETENIGALFADEIGKNDFIAFYGDLGSGKTAFMRGFVSKLVPDARVSSPTYALLNIYENDENKINHFDMYRISSEDDLISIGFYDLINDGITCTEWSENIEYALPDDYFKISFEKSGESSRNIIIERINNADTRY